MVVLPNAVEPGRIDRRLVDPAELRSKLDNTAPGVSKWVGFVGALSEEKRVHLAVEAVASRSDWGLLIAGDGPEERWLRSLADYLAPERIRFLGRRSELAEVFAMMDVLVLPSRTEGIPAVVIEAELDSSRGPIATVLVQSGTLRQGDALVVGETSGKVKAMFNDRGERIREAPPAFPAVIMGLESVPEAGERIRAGADERLARQVVEERRRRREAVEQTAHAHVNLDTLFNEISTGKLKELIIILKADVRGSAEAIKASLERLSNAEVKVKIIHSATGPVSDSDVMLAEASNGIIIAFNTRIDPSAKKRSDVSGVEIRSYAIIYQVLEDVEKALQGMLEPVFQTVIDGHAEVRQLFKSSRLGGIAGCFVTDGTLRRGSNVRVLRNNQELTRTRCEGLKRFADDVREVQTGYECGVVLSNFDKFLDGDVIEFIHEERVS